MSSASDQTVEILPMASLKIRKMGLFATNSCDKIDDDTMYPLNYAKNIKKPHVKSKLWSIVNLKCPKCQKGNLFSKTNPYTLKDGLKMPDKCPACKQDFKIEPGFYIGALWASFPIVIVLMALFSILLLGVFKMQLESFFVCITSILLLLQPIIIRLGRSIWIHIFVHHEGSAND